MDEARITERGDGRRAFLKAALMVSMTGAAGATTWWVMRHDDAPATGVATGEGASRLQTQVLERSLAPAPSVEPAPSAQARAVNGPEAELRVELENALGRVASLTEELEAYETRTAELEARLASSDGQLGVLGGLVALYGQLDDLELDEVVEGGLNELGFWVGQALSHLPGLRRGLATADRALGQFEASLPTLEEGITWLRGVINRLADGLQVMEDRLEETVEPLQPLAGKLADFAAKILGWVPFGVGKRVERGLDGMVGVLTHVPELVRSVDGELLAPLGEWFSADDKRPAIESGLLEPVKEEALRPAGRLAADVEVVDQQLTEKLTDPVRSRLRARQPVREEISRYREQYGL
jgi:hypothetical protein